MPNLLLNHTSIESLVVGGGGRWWERRPLLVGGGGGSCSGTRRGGGGDETGARGCYGRHEWEEGDPVVEASTIAKVGGRHSSGGVYCWRSGGSGN
ncbi:hypothetical protein Syun_006692 [Stephania yunnanensis]|uniref:Uncharacterized protein n=1 Tax=Stephania yunnanensis TaxID=152371 RepID=A0AAP0KXC4_9MAGN